MVGRRVRILAVVGLLTAAAVGAQEPPEALRTGIERFQAGQYSQALATFRTVISDPSELLYHGHAYYWVSRSLMAQDRLDEADTSYDYFLSTYESHPYQEQARYDRARLHYLAGRYEQAIQAFAGFVDDYPNGDLVANALYWTGESLFELGQIDSARRYFTEVVEQYPSSFRVEAARYRIDVIDLKTRENELLRLLRWSHEEYLGALEEFSDRERTYEEALQTYRRRLATLASEDFQAEIDQLTAQVTQLQSDLEEREQLVSELRGRIRQLEIDRDAARADSAAVPSEGGSAEPTTAIGSAARADLLELKNEALGLIQQIVSEGAE